MADSILECPSLISQSVVAYGTFNKRGGRANFEG